MRITAVIPCYNATDYIDECLRSVNKQTRRVDEILVVDDCSTDDTRKIVGDHSGVRLLTTKRNSGHATARNIGIAEATGEVIAWLDADDYWDASHIEVVVGLLEKHPGAAVAFSGVRCFGTVNNIWNKFPCEDYSRCIFTHAMKNTVVPAMSVVTRTDAIRAIGGYDESIRIAPDFDLWLRMSLHYKFVSTYRVTSNYRWHNGQISGSKQNEQIASMIRSRFKVFTALIESEQHEKACDLAIASRNAWTMQLWKAWEQNDKQALKFFLSLSECVPSNEAVFKKFKRRLLIPAAMAPCVQWFAGLVSKRRNKNA
jgi:glycosyltransferase involved in cell wall biosynthesis